MHSERNNGEPLPMGENTYPEREDIKKGEGLPVLSGGNSTS